MMFTTVTAGEMFAAEAELNQFEHLRKAETARLEELGGRGAGLGLKVRGRRPRQAMAEIARKQAAKAVRGLRPARPTRRRRCCGCRRRVGESVAPSGFQAPISFRPGQAAGRAGRTGTGVPRPGEAQDEGNRSRRRPRRFPDLDRDGTAGRSSGWPGSVRCCWIRVK